MLKKNDTVRAVIEGYSAEGLGIARVEGQVVFVHRALRGEDCDILLLKVLKNAAFGKVTAIHGQSPHRREPDCPYFGRCGGCDFRHMDYEEELCAKESRVRDALVRLGGSAGELEPIVPAPAVDRYRNKSQYPIGAEGTVGFYKARSHRVIPVERCLLQKEEADAAAEALRAYIAACEVPCYDEAAGSGLLRHLYVRTNRRGESLVCLVVNGAKLPQEERLTAIFREKLPRMTGLVLNENTRPGSAILGERCRTLWGQAEVHDTLCGLDFALSVPSFYQVNRDQAEVLYETALRYADLSGTETVLDLYCGAGTITQVLSARAGRVIGCEIVPQAIENARAAAARNGVRNAEFFCGDASAVAAELARQGLRPDVITVDPPRKGLTPEVIEAVAGMAPRRVVYVSCDPGTLGRDVKRFAQLGYTLRRACPVDMFPRTAHVETVALLSKDELDPKKDSG